MPARVVPKVFMSLEMDSLRPKAASVGKSQVLGKIVLNP